MVVCAGGRGYGMRGAVRGGVGWSSSFVIATIARTLAADSLQMATSVTLNSMQGCGSVRANRGTLHPHCAVGEGRVTVAFGSAHRRHDVFGAGADAGGPARGHRLEAGIEAHA